MNRIEFLFLLEKMMPLGRGTCILNATSFSEGYGFV